jgi:hypothetical protein
MPSELAWPLLEGQDPVTNQRFIGQEEDGIVRTKLLDNQLRIWFTPGVFARKGPTRLAEAAIPKDRYIDTGGIEALVITPALDIAVEHKAEVVFGKDLDSARRLNEEIPGRQLILATRSASFPMCVY